MSYILNALTGQLTPYPQILIRRESNGALLIGDFGGDPRGANSITLQSSRTLASQVASGLLSLAIGSYSTASGNHSTAIGEISTASGVGSIAIGNISSSTNSSSISIGDGATASGISSLSIGNSSTAIGDGSIAIGQFSTASGFYSTASGYYSTASGYYSTAIGNYVSTHINSTSEFGCWGDAVTRKGSVRTQENGAVAITFPTTDSATTASIASAGSETDGTVAVSMLTFRINTTGTSLFIEANFGGSIKTGTVVLV
jgi:hypothetical protein